MYKKFLFVIACNIHCFNHCFFQEVIDVVNALLKKRSEYASRLNNDINELCEFNFLSKKEEPLMRQEVVSLSELPGNIPDEAQQIVRALIDPKTYTCNPGYIFYGEPGTGKNTLASAIAKEAKAHFIDKPATEFMDTYMGRGAAEIRKLFSHAKELSRNAPVVIFIDVIDTISCRGSGRNAELVSTFNQLVNSMDQIQGHYPIVVLAATNCEDRVDTPLLCKGRFALVHVEMPNEEERFKILTYYARIYHCVFDAKFYQKIVEKTDGFCCASLEGIFKQARYLANKNGIPFIAKNHFNQALDQRMALHLKNQQIQQIQEDNKRRSRDAIQAEHLRRSKC